MLGCAIFFPASSCGLKTRDLGGISANWRILLINGVNHWFINPCPYLSLCVCNRFVDLLPANWLFPIICVLLRCTEGIGSAMLATAIFAVLPVFFPNSVATIVGLFQMANGIGYALGPPLGGVLYQVRIISFTLTCEHFFSMEDLKHHSFLLEVVFCSLLSPALCWSRPKVSPLIYGCNA